MELERDLRFYLAALLAIFLATVIGATVLLQRMTPAVQLILEENERSLAASDEMLATLARTDTSPAAEQQFAAALAAARANITEPDEEKTLAVIGEAWQSASRGDPAARERTVAALLELTTINRTAMEHADGQAQRLGRAGMWGVVLVGLLGFWIGLTVVRLARKRYILPLRDLHQTIDAARDGDLHRRVNPGDAGTELRELCVFVNDLLDDRDQAFAAAHRDRAATTAATRAVLARLLDDRAEPTVVVDADGDIDAANGIALERLSGDDGEAIREGLLTVARNGGDAAMVTSHHEVPGTNRIICVLAS